MMRKRTLAAALALALLTPAASPAAEKPLPKPPSGSFLTPGPLPYTYTQEHDNLRDWTRILLRTDTSSPEGVLARIVASIFMRDTGAGGPISPDAFLTYSLDQWLTEEGRKSKAQLALFDVSSPWLNTLAVDRVVRSSDGKTATYHLHGTGRTSVPHDFYPFAMTIRLIQGEDGQWLGDGFTTRVLDPQALQVKVDGQELVSDAAPVIQKDRLLVPFRSLAEALGASVDYRAEEGLAMVKKGDLILLFSPGKSEMVRRYSGSAGEERVPLDAPPVIIGGRMMLPARALAEALGARVEWNAPTVYVLTSWESIEQSADRDLLGTGKKTRVQLKAGLNPYSNTSDTWSLWADGIELFRYPPVEEYKGMYSHASFAFADLDGDEREEVLLSLYNTGTAGAQGLVVFKPSAGSWQEILRIDPAAHWPQTVEMKYIGNLQVSYEDKKSGLKATIPLTPDHRDMGEDLLKTISAWVDPVSSYALEGEANQPKTIHTYQRVCGVGHPDTIARLKTTYVLEDGTYKAKKQTLLDIRNNVLVEVRMP